MAKEMTEKLLKTIALDYINNKISIEKLAEKYGFNETVLFNRRTCIEITRNISKISK